MKCLTCKEEMMILELEGVEVDLCYRCGGIWLDRGELDEILRLCGGDALLEELEPVRETREKKRRCPVCKKKMEKAAVGFARRFLLDRCPDHGLWFDRGELEGIITESEGGQVEKSRVTGVLREIFGNRKSKGG